MVTIVNWCYIKSFFFCVQNLTNQKARKGLEMFALITCFYSIDSSTFVLFFAEILNAARKPACIAISVNEVLFRFEKQVQICKKCARKFLKF